MENSKIIFRCYENGIMTEKEVDRQAVTKVFEELVARFEEMNDNEISKQMIKRLPGTEVIVVNKDINETRVEPAIVFQYKEKKDMLPINRCHKIVWAILHSYCK